MQDAPVPTRGSAYGIRTSPAEGPVSAWRGDRLIARSDRAVVMRETRLPPVVYFPKEDVPGLAQTPSDRRSFCPFKGTAVYHALRVGDETLEDAAWSYPRALPESRGVEGMVGLMAGIADRIEAPGGALGLGDDGHVSSPLVDWLMREAWTAPDPATLTGDLARGFLREGIAVSRLNVTIWSLHPLIAGASYVWTREADAVAVRKARHESLRDPGYLNSPVRWVSEGLGGVRQPLTTDEAEFSFPIMEELRAEGATDYVAMPLPFSDGRINVLTLASDHPVGFTTANLGLVFECSAVISRFYEVHVQRSNARALLGAFLGRSTGELVLDGRTRRGDGEEIEAAILVCDLRGSSRLSEGMDRTAYLKLLNRFFGTVGDAVEARGGEVLKFIGDAVLAVFPAEGDGRAACAAALDAAETAVTAVGEIRAEGSEEALRCAAGASFGRVTYGNVGSATRLDFTVIGDAANVAARLTDLAKTVERPVLVSDRVADRTAAPLVALGPHRLRNISAPVAVFAP